MTQYVAQGLRKCNTATSHPCPFRTTVRHLGIIAQAQSIQIHQDNALVTTASATPFDRRPCSHDVLNAQICTYVFSRQVQFRYIRCFRAYVRDEYGRTCPVEFDRDRIETAIRRFIFQSRQVSKPIPAPLLAYLIRRSRYENI